MKLILMLEEASMKEVLDQLLPRVLPPGVTFLTIRHNGKTDLRHSIPIKLKSWREPDVRFIIVQDQDSNDCVQLKQDLQQLCNQYRENVMIRIACKELEAWYFGDLKALSQAYQKDLTGLIRKKKYRNPDKMENPKQELLKLIPHHQQISGARAIAQYMDPFNNASTSFNALISGVQRICS